VLKFLGRTPTNTPSKVFAFNIFVQCIILFRFIGTIHGVPVHIDQVGPFKQLLNTLMDRGIISLSSRPIDNTKLTLI
jgi:hypothetical protein